jgi:hypothetical protein
MSISLASMPGISDVTIAESASTHMLRGGNSWDALPESLDKALFILSNSRHGSSKPLL